MSRKWAENQVNRSGCSHLLQKRFQFVLPKCSQVQRHAKPNFLKCFFCFPTVCQFKCLELLRAWVSQESRKIKKDVALVAVSCTAQSVSAFASQKKSSWLMCAIFRFLCLSFLNSPNCFHHIGAKSFTF